MIKPMFTDVYSADDGVQQDYNICLDSCREYINNHTDILRELHGSDFNSKVEELISNYITEYKPIVDSVTVDGKVNVERLCRMLYQDINEYGPITEALLNSEYTDIYCNGIGPGNLFAKKGRETFTITNISGDILYFKTPTEILTTINRLAFSSKQRLSSSNPILYANTLHGFRLTATHDSISSEVVLPNGDKIKTPTFSIRMKASKPITLEEMVNDKKSLHPEIAKALKVIGKLERIKVLFSGAPGTGKTTLMTELIKEIDNKSIFTLERTPEIALWMYDEGGVVKKQVKSLVATKDRDDSGDMSLPTIRNLYFLTLREKVDILVLGEIRSGEEISVMLEAAVSGQGVMTSLHGEDEETTIERLVKDICQEKNATRAEAMEEVYLSVNIIVNMYLDSVDKSIKLRSITEVTKEETAQGTRLKSNVLFDFKKSRRGINPETGKVYGNYRKVGVPTPRLMRYIQDTNLTEDEEEVLTRPATPETPIIYSEVW